jgi:hypothetical protein
MQCSIFSLISLFQGLCHIFPLHMYQLITLFVGTLTYLEDEIISPIRHYSIHGEFLFIKLLIVFHTNMGYIIFFFSPSLFHGNFGLCIGIIITFVKYSGFAWRIRRVSDLMIELIGLLYNKSLSDTLSSSSDWALHGKYSLFQLNSVVLLCTPSVLLIVHLIIPRARTTGKTTSFVIKNACLLVRYLKNGCLSVVETLTSWMFLPSRCLAMGMCVTLLLLLVLSCLAIFCLCAFVSFLLVLALNGTLATKRTLQ